MKIAICNPPLEGPGVPLLGQNRQFQWFRNPFASYSIYPVIPAYAATLLKSNGYDVLWEDAVAEKKSYRQFIDTLKKEKPCIIAIETKTPVIKQHWKIIDDIKCQMSLPEADQPLAETLKCVLMGDHVSALPEESLENCSVDYILIGGDYDFGLLNLADYLSGKRGNPGSGKIVKTGGNMRGHNLNKLPIIDRELTKWELYARGNGNFKYEPNTYTMAGRDCWWRRGGGCTFCSWTSIFPQWRSAKPEKLLNEIGNLIGLGVKEVFDDTGTFPIGDWLEKFCRGMIKRKYSEKIVLGCNMRAGALQKKTFALMRKAGFRFILYGLESVNQKTLKLIQKGTTSTQLTQSLKWAAEADLEPHVTIMFGYPWETKEDAQKTIDFAKKLFNKGYINTLQATLLIPYPGTKLFAQAEKNGWLKTKDWDRYDMGEPILKTPISEEELKGLVRDCYHLVWSPGFAWRTLTSIRRLNDIKHMGFQGIKYISKLLDFR